MYVKPQVFKADLPKKGFKLKNGSYLKEINVAYETYGTLNADKNNAILVCTPLTMDHHAAGWHSQEDKAPGWWDDMIGPGKALDTNKLFVIASNMLGGCKGTTGPNSINPDTGKPYGGDFPVIAMEDIVNVQELLVSNLGIHKLAAVIGGSMGGMQALLWSVAFPEKVAKCICVAAAHNLSPQALGFEIVGRHVLVNDKNFQQGHYYDNGLGPAEGLASARMIGLLTYISADSMQSKFGRSKKPGAQMEKFKTGFEVENYLNYNAQKFVTRFDANSYLQITHALDTFDLAETYGTLEKAFQRTQCEFLLVALSSDWLFPPQQSRDLCKILLSQNKLVSLIELDSPYGHDAFILEVENLSNTIQAFLRDSRDCVLKQCQFPNSNSDEMKVFSASEDYQYIASLIEEESHILDIGCGDGELIDKLYRSKKITGYGIDISLDDIIHCLCKDVPTVQGDVDNGLTLFDNDSFDYAVLSQTLQMLKKPDLVLKEMLRVAHKAIIVFPNFGNIINRFYLSFRGKMPITKLLPYHWWETPNIHHFTLKDFQHVCDTIGIHVDTIIPVYRHGYSKFFGTLFTSNLGADLIVAKLSRRSYP